MPRFMLVAVLLVLCTRPARADAPAKGKSNVHVLAISFNQQGGAHVTDYDCFPPEYERVFRQQGKGLYQAVNSRILRGKEGTHAGILGGLTWLREQAKAGDLAVFYLTCHGDTHPRRGWHVQTVDGKTLWARELKAELAKLACPVLFILETCTSGGFAEKYPEDVPVPANVTAVCACSGKQFTNNHLDIAVLEALYGRADFDGNGQVDLGELLRYVPLRYKEWWPDPRPNSAAQTPALVKSPQMPTTLALTKVSPDLIGVVHNNTWHSALVGKTERGQCDVHLLGWPSGIRGPYFLTSAAARDRVCLPTDGRPVLVEQRGRWYPARLTSKEGGNCKVSYVGRDERETVTAARVHYPFVGDPANPNYPYRLGGQPGSWARLGQAGGWSNTIAVAVLAGRMYSVESSGCLYVTDLATGDWQQVGKPDFAGTQFLFAAGASLYSIERDGNLYRINPGDGAWARVGAAGDWVGTRAVAVLDGRLYSVEASGLLYVTDMGTGKWRQVGKKDFEGTTLMVAAGKSLYTIERDGSLYRVNPTTGAWARVGAAGDWRGTLSGVTLRGKLYTVETSGALYVTDVATGKWEQLGEADFAGTHHMTAAGDRLYTIERDGSLYSVEVK